MRVAFVGASPLAVIAARLLVKNGHEVIIIDEDAEQIEAISDSLDCGLMTGDGSRPAVLEEVGPEQTDFLFCLSNRDEANVLAALVGRSLGFTRVVPKVEDPDLESICNELGLDDVIVPDRDMANALTDLVEGRAHADLAAVVRAGLRFVTIDVPADVSELADLDLPGIARPIARNRRDLSELVDESTRLEEGDQVVLIVEDAGVEEIQNRYKTVREEDES